jgi:hypothetical protein
MLAQSWINVTLDTSPPIISIHAPSIIISKSLEYISIEANENLDVRQEIYIVDSLSKKHDYTFALEPDKKTLFNTIDFQNYPNGIATFFVVAYDEVWNKSMLYRKSINIGNVDTENVENVKLNLEIEQKEFELILKESVAEIIITLN